jgi:hypothetical protein
MMLRMMGGSSAPTVGQRLLLKRRPKMEEMDELITVDDRAVRIQYRLKLYKAGSVPGLFRATNHGTWKKGHKAGAPTIRKMEPEPVEEVLDHE